MSYYSFWYAVGGIRELGGLAGHWQLAELSGWWWPFRDVAILSRRPVEAAVHQIEDAQFSVGLARLVYSDGHIERFPADL